MAEIFNLPTKEQFDAMNTHISALSAPNATNVEYSNTTSGLTSNNAQGAIDELADRYSTVSSDIIIRNNDLDEPLANAIPLDADLLNGENPDYYAKQTDVSTLNTTVGNEILSTTAQTLTGAINEHEEQIDNLDAKTKQMGIGNLLSNSSFSNNNSGNIVPYGADVVFTFDTSDVYIAGTNSIKSTYIGTGSGSLNRGFSFSIGLAGNYVFSFWGKGFEQYEPISTYNSSLFIYLVEKEIHGDWTKYKIYINKTDNTNSVFFVRPNSNINYSFNLTINAPKLEQGGIATDWTHNEVSDNIIALNWTNATLQNGATGTLQYRKNQIGQLELRTSGNLVFGTITVATVIATLPEGYRPIANTVIMVYNAATNRAIPFLVVTTAGNIIICNDSGISAGQNTQFSAICL